MAFYIDLTYSQDHTVKCQLKVSFQRHKIDIYYKPLLCPVWSIQGLRVNPPPMTREARSTPQKLKKAPPPPPRIDIIFHLTPPYPHFDPQEKNCIDHTACVIIGLTLCATFS